MVLENQRSMARAKEQRILESEKYQAQVQAETQRLKNKAAVAAGLKKAEIDAETAKKRNALIADWAELTAKLLLIVGGIVGVIVGVFFFVTRTVRNYHDRVSETRIHEESERRKVAISAEGELTKRHQATVDAIRDPNNGLSESERVKAFRLAIEAASNPALLAPPA